MLKRKNFFVVAILMFSMIAMYGYVPLANADSLTSAKDTLSTSAPTLAATHTIVFRPGIDITTGSVVTVTFNAGFTGVSSGNATCPGDATEGGSGQDITCTVVTDLASTSDQTLTVTGVTNPGVGYYDVTISHNESGGESSQVIVYIISQVTVNATVDASLTFAINGVNAGTTVNGDVTTGTTTSAGIDFGTLAYSQVVMAQKLEVTTNAADGYTVTVQQDGNLRTAGSADIDSFATATTTDWISPTPNIIDETTWGYMGVASDDNDIALPPPNGYYIGLNGVTPLQVMTHDGPADGATTQYAGWDYVSYSVEISALQEAGDYQNTLTYICTPTF